MFYQVLSLWMNISRRFEVFAINAAQRVQRKLLSVTSASTSFS